MMSPREFYAQMPIDGFARTPGRHGIWEWEKRFIRDRYLVDRQSPKQIAFDLDRDVRTIWGFIERTKLNAERREQEDRILREMWAAAAPTREIAARIGLTSGAILIRASKLGLPARGRTHE